MATVRQQKPAASAKYDAFVQEQLDRARRRIRILDVSSALLLFLAGTLAYAFVVGLLDRRLELSPLARQLAFSGYAVAAVVFLAAAVVRPLWRRVNPYYAARAVEGVVPGAKNSLVNWLDLHGEALPPAIRASLSQRAAKDLARADLEQAVSGRRAIWLTGVTSLLVFALFGVLLTSGAGGLGTLLARTFAPFGIGIAAKSTQLTLVRPANGDAVLGVGQSFTVAVRVEGRVPDPDKPDALKLLYRYRDGEPYEEQLLDPDNGDVWAAVVPPSRTFNGFRYKVVGGDAQTPEYLVTVRSTPLVERFDVTYHYRKYTGWADGYSRDANLKALRGTEAELVVHTNRPVKEGRLEVETAGGKKPVPAELVADDPKAMRARLVLDQDGQYRVWFKTTDDESNVAATTYTITVLTDLAPKVTLTKPGADVTLPANGTLRLEGSAEDDIGVKEVTLRLSLADGPALRPQPYRPGKSFQLADGGYPKTLAYQDFVALDQIKDGQGKPFPLAKGMTLEYWLEAADACDYPKPNRGESKHFKVNISEPTPDQQQQQKERGQAAEEQKKHEKEQDQKLKEEEQKRQQEAKEQARKNEEEKNGANGKQEPKESDKSGPPKDAGDQGLNKKADEIKSKLDQQERDAQKGECKGQQDGKGQGKGDNQGGGRSSEQDKAGDKSKGQNGDGKEGAAKDEGKKPDGQQPDTGSGKREGAPHQDAAAGDGKGGGKGEQQGAASTKPDGPPEPDKGGGKDQGKGDASQGAAARKEHGNGPNDAKDDSAVKGPGQEKPGEANDKAAAKGDQPSVVKGAPKPGDPGGDPKGAQKGEGQPQGDGAKAEAKSGGQEKKDGGAVARGEAKGDHKKGSEQVAEREQAVRQGTERQSAEAEKWLENLAHNAKEKDVRDLAQKVLEDARKDRASSPALPKDAPRGDPKDGPPCQCKGGDGTMAGTVNPGNGKGSGEEKKQGEGQTVQGGGKTGGQGRPDGRQGLIARQNEGMHGLDDDHEPEAAPADPAHRRRPGVLQIEDFTKIDKDILKDLQMSPEEWAAFQKAYAEKLRREEAEKLRSGPDKLGSSPAGQYMTEKGNTSGDRTGLGRVPPEVRNAYRDYTKRQAEKK
jgi:hypothetical protein